MKRKRALIVSLISLCAASLLALCGDQSPLAVGPDGYSHAATQCLQGIEGPKNGRPGVRLLLTQTRCDSNLRRHYLDIHIRIEEEDIVTNKAIAIGDENPAFRCEKAGECEQAVDGKVMFSHYHEFTGKEALTDGWYELHFKHGLPETGRFKEDCALPCA